MLFGRPYYTQNKKEQGNLVSNFNFILLEMKFLTKSFDSLKTKYLLVCVIFSYQKTSKTRLNSTSGIEFGRYFVITYSHLKSTSVSKLDFI